MRKSRLSSLQCIGGQPELYKTLSQKKQTEPKPARKNIRQIFAIYKSVDLKEEWKETAGARLWQNLLKRFGKEWPQEPLAGRPEPELPRSEPQMSSPSPGQTCELWLCGCAFTLADVLLGATLHRLKFLGLSKKYWEDGSRPNLQSFFERVQRRFAFRKVLGDIHTTLLSAVIPNAFRLVKRKPPSFFGASFLMGSLGGMGYFAYWYLKKKYI